MSVCACARVVCWSSPQVWCGYQIARKGRRVEFDCPGAVEQFALIGEHNTANALAASLVARQAGVDDAQISGALVDFPGVLRRQQIRVDRLSVNRVENTPLTFIEDFAHHPTAVVATIDAVREAYPGRTLHVLFEPRSATSHRNIFQRRYTAAFRRAHNVYLTDIFNKKKVPAAERLDVKGIIEAIRSKRSKGVGQKTTSVVEFAKDADALLTKFRKRFRSTPGKGDVVLALSNGAFGGIYTKLDEFLGEL